MKAMGNRVSQHTIQAITLLASEEPEEEIAADAVSVAEETTDEEVSDTSLDETDIITPEVVKPSPVLVESTKKEPVEPPKEKSVKSTDESVEPSENKSVEPQENPVQHKKVDFEITNPNDIEIDDKGQLGLF